MYPELNLRRREGLNGPEIWFSICSKHQTPNPECSACQKGEWVNEEEHRLDKELFENDYIAWYKKHNGPTSYPDELTIKEMKKYFGVIIKDEN